MRAKLKSSTNLINSKHAKMSRDRNFLPRTNITAKLKGSSELKKKNNIEIMQDSVND